jgi:outer membrane lipase/esterase
MKQVVFKDWFLMVVLAFALMTPGSVEAIEFKSIVVFGGSISDPGNFFALTGVTNRPPYDEIDQCLVSTGPYARGGNHFSNGATWIEELGKSLRLNRNVNPAFRGSSRNALNYAVGGARSTDVAATVDMPEQVGIFLGEHLGIAPPEALYVIDFGGNDVRDALGLLAGGDPAGAMQLIQDALASIAEQVNRLYAAGARKFLFVNVADIGAIPSITKCFPAAAPAATQFSMALNAGLGQIIGSLPQDAEVEVLDVFGTVAQLIANPDQFGLTNVTDGCITPNDPPFSCKKPNEYLFWDGIHPTKAVHEIFADVAFEVLIPVVAKK